MLARTRYVLLVSLALGVLGQASVPTSDAQDGPPRGLENRGRGIAPAPGPCVVLHCARCGDVRIEGSAVANGGAACPRCGGSLAVPEVSGTAPRARTDGGPLEPAREKSPAAKRDPILAALDEPLSEREIAALEELAHELGARDLQARENAAREIRTRFGARAAAPLLELSRRDHDPERRFRERALVASLVHVAYAAKEHDCGWLGVKWSMSRTERQAFSVHVVEPLRDEPAALGGLRVDDEIVLWDGRALESQEDFIDRVQTAVPGSTVALTIERTAPDAKVERTVVKVVMGRRSDPTDGADLSWFHRDLATRDLARWLEAWQKTRRN